MFNRITWVGVALTICCMFDSLMPSSGYSAMLQAQFREDLILRQNERKTASLTLTLENEGTCKATGEAKSDFTATRIKISDPIYIYCMNLKENLLKRYRFQFADIFDEDGTEGVKSAVIDTDEHVKDVINKRIDVYNKLATQYPTSKFQIENDLYEIGKLLQGRLMVKLGAPIRIRYYSGPHLENTRPITEWDLSHQ